jgi:G protein beta subunit-like protein
MSSEVPDDQVIFATGGYDHTIRFWSPCNGQTVRIVQHPDSQVNAMAISHDRKFLAAAGYQHIRIYDIPGSANPNPVMAFEGVSKNVTAVGYSEEGQWMFTGGEDGSARLWDVRSRAQQSQRALHTKPAVPVNTVALHPNQSELFVGTQNGKIYKWDLRTTPPAAGKSADNKSNKDDAFVVDKDVSINNLSIDPDGSYLSAVDNKGSCYIMSLKHMISSGDSFLFPRRLKMNAHSRYALKCKFSPDSTLLVTSSADQTAKVWRTADLLPLVDETVQTSNSIWPVSDNLSPLMVLKDVNQIKSWVWDVAFSLDSQYVITGSSDNKARLWNINSGDVRREYSGHQKAITAIAFSDGTLS